MKNTLYFLLGIIGSLLLIGTVTISYAEEPDSDIFDDLDGEPESLDYFTERGFKIATLHDKYGDYFIPYKTDGTMNSIYYEYVDAPLFIFNIDNNVKTLEVIIPTFLFYRNSNPQIDDGFAMLFDGKEQEFKHVKKKNMRLFEMDLTKPVKKIEMISFAYSPDSTSSHLVSPYHLNDNDAIYFNLHPPLKQTQNGIQNNEILCKENLELILHPSSSPACVKLGSMTKLVERGWMKSN